MVKQSGLAALKKKRTRTVTVYEKAKTEWQEGIPLRNACLLIFQHHCVQNPWTEKCEICKNGKSEKYKLCKNWSTYGVGMKAASRSSSELSWKKTTMNTNSMLDAFSLRVHLFMYMECKSQYSHVSTQERISMFYQAVLQARTCLFHIRTLGWLHAKFVFVAKCFRLQPVYSTYTLEHPSHRTRYITSLCWSIDIGSLGCTSSGRWIEFSGQSTALMSSMWYKNLSNGLRETTNVGVSGSWHPLVTLLLSWYARAEYLWTKLEGQPFSFGVFSSSTHSMLLYDMHCHYYWESSPLLHCVPLGIAMWIGALCRFPVHWCAVVSTPDPSAGGGRVWWLWTGCCDTVECNYGSWHNAAC